MKVLKKKLKSLPDKALDAMFLHHHEKVFEQTDCLDCGNCCKTLGPRLTKTDVRRMAKYLRVKEGDFFA
ncbi:MAG TPA: zinc/iron-chelating domain-containing protein, partial [Bacteroidetes bacterium]|nr:zinc/iron-chelating domain-containing protein [Bacteroidota bacterium]